MTNNVSLWIAYAAIASTLIPLICLFIFRKGQPRQNLVLAISLGISILFDVIGIILAKIYHTNALSNNLYFIVAFPAIMWFYHETLVSKTLKFLVRVFTFSFLVLAVIFAFMQGLSVLNFNTMTLSSILVTITSFFFVGDLRIMDDSAFIKNPFHETNIILNTSLATYYSVTIIVFAISEYIEFHFEAEDSRQLWKVHNVVHILKNVGIAWAFYLSAKRGETLAQFKKPQTRIK